MSTLLPLVETTAHKVVVSATEEGGIRIRIIQIKKVTSIRESSDEM